MTDGDVTMGPGTVYGTIKRLLELGLVVEIKDREGPADDIQRRYYRATPDGLAALESETERLARLVSIASQKRSRSFRPNLGEA